MAVQKFANDPEVRAKVARGLKETWERAKPEIKDLKEQLKEDWEQAKPELNDIKNQLKQDWEQAKPEREKTKEKARDLTKKLTK